MLFWPSFLKDLRRSLRDPWSLALWLLIPLFIGVAITLATGGTGGVAPQASLLIVDHDESFISSFFAGAFTQGDLGSLIQTEKVSEKEGRRSIGAGEASGLLIIPKGFADAVLNGSAARLTLIKNPSEQILPQIVEQTAEVLVDGIFYVRQVFGHEISTLDGLLGAQSGPGPETLARLSTSIGDVFARVMPYLNPPLIQVDTEVTAEGGEISVNVGLLFLPGIVMMAIFLVAQNPAEDLWDERMFGTLRRIRTSPGGVFGLLWGKLATGVVLILVVSAGGLAIGMLYYGIGFTRFPGAVAWCGLVGMVLILLLVAVQLFASSRRSGSIMSTALLFPLLMLGGSFFPSEAMPRWMGSIGRWTPNGRGVEILKDMLLGRLDRWELTRSTGVLLALGLVLGVIVVLRIRRDGGD